MLEINEKLLNWIENHQARFGKEADLGKLFMYAHIRLESIIEEYWTTRVKELNFNDTLQLIEVINNIKNATTETTTTETRQPADRNDPKGSSNSRKGKKSLGNKSSDS
jgi:hypothetical protein